MRGAARDTRFECRIALVIENGDLLLAVEREFLPLVSGLPLKIIEHQEGTSFDLASVTLEGGNVRVRLQRERGPIHTGFAATSAPFKTFDSFVILDLLGLSSHSGLTGTDLHVVLRGVAAFLRQFWSELDAAFAPASARGTIAKLETIQVAQAKERWG